MQINTALQSPGAISGTAMSSALVVAFVIQQIIEIVDSFASAFFDADKDPEKAGKKKAVLKLCSLACGTFAAKVLKLDVLSGVTLVPFEWHWFISAFAFAGGTEGVNSVVKYLGYAKEDKKNDAAGKLDPARKDQLKSIGRK